MIINLTTGSLGLAYYRLLYVKIPHWVKFTIGERNLLCVISLTGFASSILTTFLFGQGQAKSRAGLNMCLGKSYISVVSLIDSYLYAIKYIVLRKPWKNLNKRACCNIDILKFAGHCSPV